MVRSGGVDLWSLLDCKEAGIEVREVVVDGLGVDIPGTLI